MTGFMEIVGRVGGGRVRGGGRDVGGRRGMDPVL